MSRLNDLIEQAKRTNPDLGQELAEEVSRLENNQAFGLVFERHEPEATELYGRTVRPGAKVHVLPERGSLEKPDPRLWRVGQISRDQTPTAELVEILPGGESWDTDRIGREPATTTAAIEDLVVVAEHGDDIHMDLTKTGDVRRGADDDPEHMVINAENLHALQMLAGTHAGKIDAIYIDPPYNTGDKSWKYNNNYFDRKNTYRHSKWLAFMEQRLKLAKELLNPEDSVLIVTIDEKEHPRLALLLEQVFPEARIQMVSVQINPQGSARAGFGRKDEYYFFVQVGTSKPAPQPLGTHWATNVKKDSKLGAQWASLRRCGTINARRVDRPGLFYPIFVNEVSGSIHSFGQPIAPDADRTAVSPPAGTVAVWPVRSDGSEGYWQLSSEKAAAVRAQGLFRAGRYRGEKTAFSYLRAGERAKVEDGTYKVTGYTEDGTAILDTSDYVPTYVPGTQWAVPSHNAGVYGTNLTEAFLGDRRFTYPKSLYAVEDALRFFVANKPEATVLDFFAGSGTTAHAVMRLNKQDGGRRRSISVTNNEVSAEEQAALITKGLRPGDPEWEARGVAEHVTKPRITAAITGRTAASGFTEPVKGRYKFVDEFDMADGIEATATFWTLTYLDPAHVENEGDA